MACTLLMTSVLIVGFVLMFALVKFAEGIISVDPLTEETTAGSGKP